MGKHVNSLIWVNHCERQTGRLKGHINASTLRCISFLYTKESYFFFVTSKIIQFDGNNFFNVMSLTIFTFLAVRDFHSRSSERQNVYK